MQKNSSHAPLQTAKKLTSREDIITGGNESGEIFELAADGSARRFGEISGRRRGEDEKRGENILL